MSPISLILLAITGLLGVYLYLLQSSQHQEQQREAVVHHRLESERFEADFRAAWRGQPLADDIDQARRIEALKAEAADIDGRRKIAEAEARRAGEEIKKSIEEMAK